MDGIIECFSQQGNADHTHLEGELKGEGVVMVVEGVFGWKMTLGAEPLGGCLPTQWFSA